MMPGTHVLPPTNACTGMSPVRLLMRYEHAVASGSSLVGMWQLWQLVAGACANWLCCHSANVRSIGNGWPVLVPSSSLSVFSGAAPSKPSAKMRSDAGTSRLMSGELTLWQTPQVADSVWDSEDCQ